MSVSDQRTVLGLPSSGSASLSVCCSPASPSRSSIVGESEMRTPVTPTLSVADKVRLTIRLLVLLAPPLITTAPAGFVWSAYCDHSTRNWPPVSPVSATTRYVWPATASKWRSGQKSQSVRASCTREPYPAPEYAASRLETSVSATENRTGPVAGAVQRNHVVAPGLRPGSWSGSAGSAVARIVVARQSPRGETPFAPVSTNASARLSCGGRTEDQTSWNGAPS